MTLLAYFRIWLASIRYSVARTMMFRFDFLLWVVVDVAWMGVNLMLIEVIFSHVDSVAGWDRPRMILLTGTSMLVTRLFMAFFLTNLFGFDRMLREGTLDFTLAQPGNPLFMISTRKVELDGLTNTIFALGIVAYAVRTIPLAPGLLEIGAYLLLVFFGLVIHYSTVVMLISLGFWMTRVQGIEMGYFGLFDLSRLPRRALRGTMEIIFVYVFPAVIISNFSAEALLSGPQWWHFAWLGGIAFAWFALAVVLQVSTAERGAGGHERDAALEDATEALVAAVYLDSDWDTVRRVVLGWYGDIENSLGQFQTSLNPKGQLQELVQPNHGNSALTYRTVRTYGPPHARMFEIEVLFNDRPLGSGSGSSKKEAEEAAAREALKNWPPAES